MLPTGLGQRVLYYGNFCVDNVLTVASYPKEDGSDRAKAARKSVGGNAGNSTRVLAQLVNKGCHVSIVAPVPSLSDPDTMFSTKVLAKYGIDTSLLVVAGGDALPSSFVLSSAETGSRTIVSTRNDCPELSVSDFTKVLHSTFATNAMQEYGSPAWCHLECRQHPEVILQMAKAWRAETAERSLQLPLSVEVEKPSINPAALSPLLAICKFVLFSQPFVEAHHDFFFAQAGHMTPAAENAAEWEEHIAMRCLRAIRATVGIGSLDAIWICTWGEHGAFALQTANRKGFYEPAQKQPIVVDSVGAGDTFLATCLHELLNGSDAQRTLHSACAVAGRKVSQVGYDNLQGALPQNQDSADSLKKCSGGAEGGTI